MPIYVIEDELGNRQEVFRTIARRDCLPKGFKRVFVPTRALLYGAIDPGSPLAAVPKGYREIELKGRNWRDIEREGGFSRDHIRRVWNF